MGRRRQLLGGQQQKVPTPDRAQKHAGALLHHLCHAGCCVRRLHWLLRASKAVGPTLGSDSDSLGFVEIRFGELLAIASHSRSAEDRRDSHGIQCEQIGQDMWRYERGVGASGRSPFRFTLGQ
jgi:hypothetical protein